MVSKRELFLRHVAQTSPFPLSIEIKEASGVYLFDKEGRKIMDFISGIGVSALGHQHPVVVEAIQKQSRRYLHTMVYGEFVLSPQVALAQYLSSILPQSLESTYFLNSGSEAVDASLKLAMKATGRRRIISARHAYHGSSFGAMSLMSDTDRVHPFGGPVLDVRHIEYNRIEDLQLIDDTCAAVLVETVQAESGIHEPKNGYLKYLRDKCSESGCLLILDEIQAGLGRTGHLFAFHAYGITPDILLLGKAFGGGLPLSAVISSKERLDEFTENPILGHITTFGGHPLSCAAGLASLKYIVENDLPKSAAQIARSMDRLDGHPAISEYRRVGFWASITLDSMDEVLKVCESCMHSGLFIDWFLFNDRSIRICPPLIMSQEELEHGLNILEKQLDAMYRERI